MTEGPEQKPPETGELMKGMALCFGATILFGGVVPAFLSGLGSVAIDSDVFSLLLGVPIFIGLTQLIWVLPLLSRLQKRGLHARRSGVILAASITFLLNGACWGMIATSNMNFH